MNVRNIDNIQYIDSCKLIFQYKFTQTQNKYKCLSYEGLSRVGFEPTALGKE